jgi:UDP-glucose 4-epimerase
MRVLVTGGAGFIGSHLVDALVRRGDQVTILDDLSSGNLANLAGIPAGTVRVVGADVADPGTVRLVAELEPQLVFHLAAQVSVVQSMSDPDRDRDVNVAGTRHVLSGAARARSARVVFVSSGGAIYGEATRADEDAPVAPASYYGVHKFTAERYVALDDLSYGIARLANVYGARQRRDLEGGVVAIFLERLRSGQPVTIYGSGDQRRDFVHVDDVVRALLAMGDSRVDGIWNVGTGSETSVNELLRALVRELGGEAEVAHLPPREGEVFSSSLSSARIAADLDWRPALTLAEGLRVTIGADQQPADP